MKDVSAIAVGIVRGGSLRAHTVATLQRWGTTIRNVYRINEGLHPDVRSRGVGDE